MTNPRDNLRNNYSIHLPSYSIGDAVYDKINSICSPYGKKIIVIGGHKAIQAVKDLLLEATEKAELLLLDFLWFGGESSYENVSMLMTHPSVLEADMIFAIGGGKAIDTCKCLATKLAKPVFTFPTIASTCAACTTVSIMYHPNGRFLEPFFFPSPPTHAFIHTTVIGRAPRQYIWAGIGDTYAKYYECTVSSRLEELVHYNALGVQLSRMCVDPLLQYGEKALLDNVAGHTTYELEQTILAIIVTTGIVSILVTTEHTVDYNSGLAHAIFYALTSLPHIEEDHLHGEVVGFGVLLLLLLDKQTSEFERLYQFNKSIGLPTALSDLELTREHLSEVIPRIVVMPDIRHFAYQVTEEMLWDAFEQLDAYSAKRC